MVELRPFQNPAETSLFALRTLVECPLNPSSIFHSSTIPILLSINSILMFVLRSTPHEVALFLSALALLMSPSLS